MKNLIPIFALAVVGFASPAFAVDLSTVMSQAPCEEAGGVWDQEAAKCVAQDSKRACDLAKGQWDSGTGTCKKK